MAWEAWTEQEDQWLVEEEEEARVARRAARREGIRRRIRALRALPRGSAKRERGLRLIARRGDASLHAALLRREESEMERDLLRREGVRRERALQRSRARLTQNAIDRRYALMEQATLNYKRAIGALPPLMDTSRQRAVEPLLSPSVIPWRVDPKEPPVRDMFKRYAAELKARERKEKAAPSPVSQRRLASLALGWRGRAPLPSRRRLRLAAPREAERLASQQLTRRFGAMRGFGSMRGLGFQRRQVHTVPMDPAAGEEAPPFLRRRRRMRRFHPWTQEEEEEALLREEIAALEREEALREEFGDPPEYDPWREVEALGEESFPPPPRALLARPRGMDLT